MGKNQSSDEHLCFWVPATMKSAILRAAHCKGIPTSEWVRRALTEQLKRERSP